MWVGQWLPKPLQFNFPLYDARFAESSQPFMAGCAGHTWGVCPGWYETGPLALAAGESEPIKANQGESNRYNLLSNSFRAPIPQPVGCSSAKADGHPHRANPCLLRSAALRAAARRSQDDMQVGSGIGTACHTLRVTDPRSGGNRRRSGIDRRTAVSFFIFPSKLFSYDIISGY